MMVWASAALLVALLAIGSDAAKSFRQKAYELEARDIPISIEVKERGEKKHLVLYHYNGVKREDLVELPPLDVDAFIQHGLAKRGDKLMVEYFSDTGELVAHFRRARPSPQGNWMDLQGIYNAGDVGYVYLPGKQNDSNAYYVRVPINLFPQLDGKALQKKGIEGTFSSYSFNTCKTPGSTFDCVLMNFSSPGNAPTQQLATRLQSIWSHFEVKMVTTEEIARIAVPAGTSKDDPLPYDVNPRLASDSYLQYLIALRLHSTDFNYREPKFVQQHGRLPADYARDEKGYLVTKVTGKPTGMVQLEFVKDGVKQPVAFPIKECKLGYYIRTDETKKQPDGIGITYIYKLQTDEGKKIPVKRANPYTYKRQPDETKELPDGTGIPTSGGATNETKELPDGTGTPTSGGASDETKEQSDEAGTPTSGGATDNH